jgi:hypothetical protein
VKLTHTFAKDLNLLQKKVYIDILPIFQPSSITLAVIYIWWISSFEINFSLFYSYIYIQSFDCIFSLKEDFLLKNPIMVRRYSACYGINAIDWTGCWTVKALKLKLFISLSSYLKLVMDLLDSIIYFFRLNYWTIGITGSDVTLEVEYMHKHSISLLYFCSCQLVVKHSLLDFTLWW